VDQAGSIMENIAAPGEKLPAGSFQPHSSSHNHDELVVRVGMRRHVPARIGVHAADAVEGQFERFQEGKI